MKCIAALVVACAAFGFSTERSEAASSATMVFTVDAGLLTHINITAPFGFYPNTGDTQDNLILFIHDLFPGDLSEMTAFPAEVPTGMLSVAGSGMSYDLVGMTGGYFGAEEDGDFALIFLLGENITLTSEDFIEITGQFALSPSSNLAAPLAGSYTSALYMGSESGSPISNTIMVEVIVNAVPEPGSCLLGLMGAASLLFRRKR